MEDRPLPKADPVYSFSVDGTHGIAFEKPNTRPAHTEALKTHPSPFQQTRLQQTTAQSSRPQMRVSTKFAKTIGPETWSRPWSVRECLLRNRHIEKKRNGVVTGSVPVFGSFWKRLGSDY